MGGRTEFDMTFGVRGGDASVDRKVREEGAPFRLLLMGDFSGRAIRRERGEAVPLKRPLVVDAGDLDRAVAALAPAVPVVVGNLPEETVRFSALEDFHPDHLFARLAMFETPGRLRRELARSTAGGETFTAVEAWLSEMTGAAPGAGPPSSTASGTTAGDAAESTASALERLLGRGPAAGSAPPATDLLQGILQQAVRPHLTSDDDVQRRALLLSVVDEVLTAQLRAVLASPALRPVEAAWRGVERIARAVDTDQSLVIALFDACPRDLDEALVAAGGDLARSELHRLLVGSGSNDQPWSVIAVAWDFGLELAELQRLATLGALAARTGAILLADASLTLIGCTSPADAADPARWQTAAGGDAATFWQALRESPVGRSIGLVLPRILARLPYGKKTDPIDSFPFEELSSQATRSPTAHRLWGSGAFGLAQLYAAAFRAEGWSGDVDGTELEDLPSHAFDDEGETRLVPAGQVAWPERAVEPLLTRGITPLLARRDRAALHLSRSCSIAVPSTPLTVSSTTGD